MKIAQTQSTKRYFEYDQVLEETKRYFQDDELSATTWINKYAVKTSDGKYLEKSPDDMHWRMAREFARIERNYPFSKPRSKGLSEYGKMREVLDEDAIYKLFKNFEYVIPQGSVMAALGNSEMIASLSNCVVVPPVFDSYGGIMYTDQQLVQLFKRRCGVGVDI